MTDPNDGTVTPDEVDDETGVDDTLPPSEATDSAEVAPKNDGDEVVDPPEEWHGVDEPESLEEKLEAEVPDRPSQRPPDDDDSFYSVIE